MKENNLVTYKNWKKLIEQNFHSYFWVPFNSKRKSGKYHLEPHFVKREGIYKDCYS